MSSHKHKTQSAIRIPPPHGYGEYVVDIEYVFVGNYCWKLEYPHGCVS
jgi:hypothetical protein